jgi:hypothetical protein
MNGELVVKLDVVMMGVGQNKMFPHIPWYSPGGNALLLSAVISISSVTKIRCLHYLTVEKLEEPATQTSHSKSLAHPGNQGGPTLHSLPSLVLGSDHIYMNSLLRKL